MKKPEMSNMIRDDGYGYGRLGSCRLSEISEELDDEDDNSSSTDLFEINRLSGVGGGGSGMSSVFSFDVHGFGGGDYADQDCVYVAVKNGDTSMDALAWTLRDIQHTSAPPSTAVYLVHVFPLIHSVPTPLGNLPIRDVIPEQVETHKAQERYKKREMLQKFVTACIAYKVKVDTILIESDRVAKSIVELISMLNIRKLVIGTSKSNLRRLGTKKGNGGIVDEIVRKAPEYCQVKIVCEGKEVDQDTDSSVWSGQQGDHQVHCMDFFSCLCLKPNTTTM